MCYFEPTSIYRKSYAEHVRWNTTTLHVSFSKEQNKSKKFGKNILSAEEDGRIDSLRTVYESYIYSIDRPLPSFYTFYFVHRWSQPKLM